MNWETALLILGTGWGGLNRGGGSGKFWFVSFRNYEKRDWLLWKEMNKGKGKLNEKMGSGRTERI